MQRGDGSEPCLDLDALPAEVAAALEAALAGGSLALVRSGRPVGSLASRPHVLEGTVVTGPAPAVPPDPPPAPDGVCVVATAMRLSDAARGRLSQRFGDDYLVLDITEAPETADVLLTHPVSPQLLGILRRQFPRARVVVTEVDDEELGVHYAGPVSRLLDAGAAAYLPPRPLAELADGVHAWLTRDTAPELEPRAFDQRVLPGAPEDDVAP